MHDQFSRYYQSFEAQNACVIIPTYNNAGTLEDVLKSVLQYTDRVIVVNDGSTDGTSAILEKFPDVAKIAYTKNGGKGKALRRGFAYASQAGYDYAVTIDSDGQHFASDLPLFLERMAHEKSAIIIGARNLQQENMPGKNSFANRFSNFWFYVETGKKGPDTQSGYRLYPIHMMRDMRFFGTKYEFEVEVLVRCAWKGIKTDWIPINVYYPPADKRVSHFRPFPDFSRISALNTILVLIAFLYIKPRDFILKMSRIDHVKEVVRQNLFNKEESIVRKSASIGFGIFMGIVPIWGFQMITAVLLASLLRLNKVLTLIAANISIPPLVPVIIFLSFLTGRLWVHRKAANLIYSGHITLRSIWMNLEQYIYGSITLAIIAGLAAYGITYSVLHLSSRLRAKAQQAKN